jgi:hypothetical protein
MAAFNINMENLKKQITFVFLLAFTLIKVSPLYYRYQFLPGQQNVRSGANFKPAGYGEPSLFLVKVDKSIIDETNHLAVPQIKFSGICFELFFAALCLTLLVGPGKFIFNKYPLQNTPVYLFQRVFRL